MASSTRRVIYEIRRLTGRILARGRLHRICTDWIDGAQVVMKSRRLGSRFAIAIGNLSLRLQCSEVEILSLKEWLHWEMAVDTATNGRRIFHTAPSSDRSFHGLVFYRQSGRPLSEILADEACSIDAKFSAIAWALDSLHQLHHHQADWGNGIRLSISHGDATASNVMVCFESKSTCWIDFDIRHQPHLSELDRHSDDLRALIFSSAVSLTPSCYPKLADTLIASARDQITQDHFRKRLRSDWHRPNTF